MIHGNTGRKKNALQREILSRGRVKGQAARRTHGLSKTTEFAIWRGMLQRCTNPNYPRWNDYGGRGIVVCERWHDFSAFLADMGARPDGTSLDRINTNGNYEPGNCRWATPRQQQNNMRSNRYITVNGVTRSVSEWATALGINKSTLTKRLSRSGWSPEEAITQTLQKGRRTDLL